MGQIIRGRVFSGGPPRPRRPDSIVIALPVKVKSCAPRPRRPRAPAKGSAARRVLEELEAHVCSATCALAYLRGLARANPDPRAVAALLRDVDRTLLVEPGELRAGLTWAFGFLAELEA